MQLQEEYNKKVWWVLKKIRRNCALNNSSLPVQYEIYLLPAKENFLSSKDECDILNELAKSGAIQILRRCIKSGLRIIVYIDTIGKKFNEVYERFELMFDKDPFPKKFSQNVEPIYNQKDVQEELSSRQKLKHETILFSRHSLKKDVEQFESTLKYFFELGAVNKGDYKLLVSNSKMVKRFLSRDIPPKKKRKSSRTKQTTPLVQLPLPITGEIAVKGLDESLKALRPKSPESAGPKYPYKIPAGTHWNNVIIKFLDDERVEIHVKRLKHVTDYKEMGMVGKGKVQTPSEQWLFLKVLAQCLGEISIKDPEAKEKYKKQKQVLSEILQNYFSIDYDPFYPYQSSFEKGGNSYKIKFLLIPPPEKDHKQNITEDDTDPLGIHEFLRDPISR